MEITFLNPEDASLYTPTRGSLEAAGFDLYYAGGDGDKIVIPRALSGLMNRKVVPLGFRIMSLPEGTYGRIAPRSGLAAKNGIDVGAGVLDSDFRGEVKVVLFNLDPNVDKVINKGDRIAQLILERYVTADVWVVEDLTTASTILPRIGGERGAGGFGSTGN